MELSIIIVNYRSERHLKNCIASVFKFLKNINFEIIVVNNDEKENLGKIKKEFPEVAVINHQKNIGFGAACNKGAKQARGETLLFLNPDTEIMTDNLSIILNKLKENKEIAVIGPRLTTLDGKTQWWCAGKEFTFWQLLKNNLGIIESKKIWESGREIFADWVSGAALFMKKEILEKIGGFDEKFFMYAEDLDLCRRIKKLGYKILYYPKISILHIGGKSRESFIKQKIQFSLSTFYFLTKSRNN